MRKDNTTSCETDASEKTPVRKIIDPRIIRSPHDRENPYVMINKNLINESSLSPECRFFLIFLLSKPVDWDITTSQLQKELKPWIGRKKILSLYKEAISAGYMKRNDIKKGNIRIDCIYYVSENPIYRDEFKNSFRESPFRTCEQGTVILSNDINKRNNTKKSEPGGSPPKTPPPEAIIFYKNIGDTGITREEYDKLEKEIGSIELGETLESLNKWLKFDTKRKIKRKGIVQKIKDWNRRYQREKSVLKQREDKIQQEEYNKEKERYNEIIRTNKLEVEELIQHRNFKQDVYFDKNLVIVDDGKKRKWYSMNDPGLAKCLEKILEEKKE